MTWNASLAAGAQEWAETCDMVHSTGSWGEVSRRMHHAVGCSTISRQQHEAAPACWFCCSGLLGSLAQSERVDVGGRLKHRAAAVCPMIQLG